MSFIIAIDGPAGSGKGTIAKKLAKKLNFVNVDTGAMYRCVALKCLENNIKDTDIDEIKKVMNKIDIKIKTENHHQTIYLDEKDVTKKIRTKKVDNCVAKFAQIGLVREKLVDKQKKLGKEENLVMEGRDIGTVVFPNANVKIYLDASIEERANRRYKQNIEKEIECSYEEILESIKQRHKLETEREISPLVQAKDAHYIDSSNLTIDQVVEKIIELVNKTKDANK